MKAHPQLIESFSEQAMLSAWREQLAQATPGLSQTLVTRQPELLPRFAAYYSHLQQLPRRVRRNLQRQFRKVRPRIGVRGRRAHHLFAQGTRLSRIGRSAVTDGLGVERRGKNAARKAQERAASIAPACPAQMQPEKVICYEI